MDTPPIITEEQIQKWREERGRRAWNAIQAILEAERCELQALPSITPEGRIVARVVLAAL